jgi:hypothetical protein
MSNSSHLDLHPNAEVVLEADQSELEEFDDELDWNAQNGTHSHDKESIDFASDANSLSNPGDNNSEPMSESEIKDAFGFGSSPANKKHGRSYVSSDDSENLTFASAPNIYQSEPVTVVKNKAKVTMSATNAAKIEQVKHHPADRVREQKLKETVQNIAGKLKWHADEMDRKMDGLNDV